MFLKTIMWFDALMKGIAIDHLEQKSCITQQNKRRHVTPRPAARFTGLLVFVWCSDFFSGVL